MISSLITAIKLKEIFLSYFVKKGLDSLLLKKEEDFQSRLKKIIDDVIEKYMSLYPANDNEGKYAFYKSQRIIDELLKYRLMSNQYSFLDLEKVFEEEINVIPPDKTDLENFYKLFLDRINEDDLIKQLEISSTFEEEIFRISRKVDSNSRNLENVINNIHTQLDAEWERQINVYKDNIYSFKPVTALELLNRLESSFELSKKPPTISLKATIEYLKGQCLELIGNIDDMHKCYIRAYRLDPNPIVFKEKACFAFAINDNIEEAKKVLSEILFVDEYNYVAWAVIVFTSEQADLISQLNTVPKIVIEDFNFKRVVYLTTRNKFDFVYIDTVFEKYSIIPEIDQFPYKIVTFKNYKGYIFLIETTISKLFQSIYIDFSQTFSGDTQIIKSIKPFVEIFLEQISESEIIKNYKTLQFYNEFFQLVLAGNDYSILKMKLIYDSLDKPEDIIVLLMANCLQLLNKEEDAIMIINKQPTTSLQLLQLKAFCHLKKNNIEDYIKISKEILINIKKVNDIECENILIIINGLHAYGRLDSIVMEEFLKDKEFEYDYLKTLIVEFISILLNQNTPTTLERLQSIEEDLLNSSTKLLFHINLSYFILGEHEIAINLCSKYLNKEVESRDLFYYIRSLDKSSIHNEELLFLLKKWRKYFSFNEELLRIEADLRRQLSDWVECSDVCECFLSKYKNEESFLTLYLISVNELCRPDKDDKIIEIASIFSVFNFKQYAHAQIVSNILIQNNNHKIALDIIYKHAIIKENKQARMDYFSACIHVPYEIIKEKEIVDIGLFVKYDLNSDINFIEINDSNPLSKSLIGHKVGDEIFVQRPMLSSTDKLKILRVMDKYLYLHDEILEEVKNNPYSGIPMQSVEFKDTSPEGLVNTLISLFGANGSIIKEKRENAFLEYYNYRSTFSEIILQNYSSDYIGGYFNLIHYRDGITLIPANLYPNDNLTEFKNIVLDFTSLLIFYQISREHSVEFQQKFIISKGIFDYIKGYKKKESNSIREEMSIDISLDGVTKSTKPEDVYKSNIQYLIKLIDWIEQNCIIKIAESRLNVTRKLDREIRNELFANYVIDNISLVQEHENCILITDDHIHLKFFPLSSSKTFSTELYISSCFGNEISIMSEFIKNKYIGITISKDMLLFEFNRKLKDQINYYNHCLNNLSLALHPNHQNIFTIIRFLKEISVNSLLIDDSIKREAVNAFVSLLKGTREVKVFKIAELVIRKEFKLLGTKLDLILESFFDAVSILNITGK